MKLELVRMYFNGRAKIEPYLGDPGTFVFANLGAPKVRLVGYVGLDCREQEYGQE